MMHVTEKIEHLQIPLESIKLATNNFADENCIGRGGFGKVYKGKLVLFGIPMIVAIKRLDPKFGQGNSEFLKEIVTLSSYKHENIVSILGFCDENVEKILIYEYASKGSLNSYLNNGDLKWIPRLNICIGAARGLAYLHDFGVTHRRVLHRDIKSSNILLDENWNARITDLGLSKFGLANQQYTFLVSNNGYCCDPLYVETGLLTEESDVYSFGVVLFEVLCDRLSIGNNSDKCRPWTELVRQYYEEGNINEIIQANLKDQITSSSLQVFTKIAYQCLSRELNRRPEMTEVVSTLEKALQYQWDDTYLRDTVGMDVSKGITFTEVNSVRASGSKVVCCHFSSDGKLLASGGHDKKAVVWYTDSLKPKTILEGHSLVITDVRFSTIMSRLATSSFDKTVRGWDAESSGFPLHTFTGHSAPVLSLDFHPNINDLLCSCDGDGEIRYWSIQNGSCTRVFKERMNHVRFQPRHGRFLAAAAPKIASILDIETQACQLSLQGHTNPINFVCWDPSGEYLASLSEDSVRVWSLTEGVCVRDLSSNGNQFHSCVFHPSYASVLVIGCYKSLELWNLLENNTMTLSAHEGLIAGLAGSTTTGLVASAGHDKIVTLWN